MRNPLSLPRQPCGDGHILGMDPLAAGHRQAADLVQLRYFAGLTLPEAAQALGISPRTASRLWAYARAWLRQEIEGAGNPCERS